MAHSKTVKIAKSVLGKIFNKQFRTPTIYRLDLIYVDKFCWLFFHQLQIGVLKKHLFKKFVLKEL